MWFVRMQVYLGSVQCHSQQIAELFTNGFNNCEKSMMAVQKNKNNRNDSLQVDIPATFCSVTS